MQKSGRAPAVWLKKSLADLLVTALAVAMTAGLSFGAVWMIEQLQLLRCPAETFLNGSGPRATIVQIFSIVLASLGFGFLASNWVAHQIPSLRKFARGHSESRYQKSRQLLARFSVIAASILLPVGVAASFSQYCLAEREILYQPRPWASPQQYSWQDVVTIETSCTRGSRSGWNPSLFLTMGDGASFDIMAWPRPAFRAYPDIARSLEGVAFAFSSTGVSPRCPYADLLTRRPQRADRY